MREKILTDRYLQPEETEEQMYRRVANHISDGDKELSDEFFTMMNLGLFLPNSPTLVNAGTTQGTLSACFVVPVSDDLKGIYSALESQGMIHKAFGGTGFDFSSIRSSGSRIESTGGEASGPVAFMELFNANAEAVRQGGKRQGANMGVLRIDHPDIEEFIDCKTVEGRLSHFNISVALTKEFMDAVLNDESFSLIEPKDRINWDGEQRIPIVKVVRSRDLMEKICLNIWKNGEPGVVFIDEINNHNPTPSVGMFEATNPCGEQPLLPYESCNLGSINLSKFVVVEGKDGLSPDCTIDYGGLRQVVHCAVEFLDKVIDVNNYPLDEIERNTLLTRKIGLGVMGWHDMLIKLGIPYDSNDALEYAEAVMSFINTEAISKSVKIAIQKSSFPTYSGSTWQEHRSPIRNSTLTTIAPTGSISLIAECSSGVEPIFAWKHMRKIEAGNFEVVHPTFDTAVAWDNPDMMKTSMDISVDAHIKMQATFQKHVHNAVSKTINLPNDATVDDIDKAIMLAYVLKCKGVTLYRNGSREEQVLSILDEPVTETVSDRPDGVEKFISDYTAPPIPNKEKSNRPNVLEGKTSKHRSGCGSLFITVNELNEEPFELFVHHSSGGCQSNMEAIGRLITLALKSGINVGELIAQLDKIKCVTAAQSSKSEGNSCAQIIGMRLLKFSEELAIKYDQRPYHIEKGSTDDKAKVVFHTDGIEFTAQQNVCPECGEKLEFGEGCMNGSCSNCGWSGCL